MSCTAHIQYLPVRQKRHCQQGTICSETARSPIASPYFSPAPSPSATTSPTNSWPGVIGGWQ